MQFFPQVIHQNKINCQHLSRNQNNSTNNATDVLSPQIGRLTSGQLHWWRSLVISCRSIQPLKCSRKVSKLIRLDGCVNQSRALVKCGLGERETFKTHKQAYLRGPSPVEANSHQAWEKWSTPTDREEGG